MKKKYILVIALCAVFALSLVFAACGNKNNATFEWEEYTEPAAVDSTDSVNLPSISTVGPAAKDSVQIHYQRNRAAEYSKWKLWLWTTSGSIGSNEQEAGWAFNYKDDWGVIALYTIEDLESLQGGKGGFDTSEQIGLIVRDADWGKDFGSDRFFSLGQKDANNYYHIYVKQGEANLYNSIDEFKFSLSAKFIDDKQIEIVAATPLKNVQIYGGDKVIAETKLEQQAAAGRCTLSDDVEIEFNQTYKIKATFAADNKMMESEVTKVALMGGEAFGKLYNYDGELGAIYSPSQTVFKVWSPLSTSVTLKLYEAGNGGSAYKTVSMTKGDKGVWSATVDGDLAAKYYTYTVVNSSYPQGAEIVDPYAKSAGLNGGRGQIVNFDDPALIPDGWDSVSPIAYKPNELTVWETHVADVTSSATWNGTEKYRKKFLGMIEEGTTYTKDGVTVKTGFDHIKELGVNAVQLVPIFDQANDEVNVQFNWGYNPLNYNVVEGAYSTDASDGYVRIREFRELIKAFSDQQINIIMDVVYNHVSAAIGSNFDVLCPGYYFRYNDNGELSSGSGCGNDTASNHYMFRKFMIDSVCFWAEEYKLGGFRFDLMGLHDLETMNQLTAALKKINPDIIVYGEPWKMTTACSDAMATQDNGNKYEGFAQFSDQMRDALIKGGMSGATEKGWVDTLQTLSPTSGEVTRILNGLKGYTYMSDSNIINDLAKTVNYVTCHDNYTLYDRMVAAQGTSYNARFITTYKNMAMLADSVVFTSNGITFMLAGDEFLRSKKDLGANDDQVHNSYEAPYKVNELDYSRKITNIKYFENFRKLIAFKQSFVDMGLVTNADVEANYKARAIENGSGILIEITDAKNHRLYRIVHVNYTKSVTADFAGYTLYLDTLDSGISLSAQTKVDKLQTIIAYKDIA